ncbi:putative C-type lectin domain family 20 member A [Nothobranchius furzeri]|uniref:LOC107377217-like protein n=1 Tax=Nothobranchius furzeri TaxID=105023 RepID=A0A9D3C0R4_NOTFU|nr:putative LOC107377217-like protein [Nothobranchius furzeri]
MGQTFTCILILLSFFGAFGKYVYVKEARTWLAAQSYCRQKYTDLAPLSSKRDINLMQMAGNTDLFSWIGMKTTDDTEKWMWWGGGRISWMFWDSTGTTNMANFYGFSQIPFFCYNPIVVKQRSTWEAAWQYCRDNHNMLASVASEVEMQLIQRKLNQAGVTQHVWIGLHFFPGDGWLWLDNQPLGYESWGLGGKPGCPRVNLECAALKVNGWRDNSSGSTSNPSSSLELVNNLLDSEGPGNSEAAPLEEGVWEATDCQETLSFICY